MMAVQMPRVGILAAGAALLAACASPVESSTSEITLTVDVEVTSDPGVGVGGVSLGRGTATVATTDAAGRARFTVSGEEGDVVEIAVACPAGYDSPTTPLSVALRRLSTNVRSPRFAARCTPQLRTAVVGIRAENGPGIPVMYLGREVGRTDGSGAALVLLSAKPHEPISLVLDTKGAGASRLRPESPTLTFVTPDRDELVTLDQKFDIERTPAPRRPSGPRPTSGPTKL